VASDGQSQLRWGLRRFLPAFLLAPLVLAAVALTAAQDQEPEFQARALVVATASEVQLAVLPRFGEAVFNSGAVARSISTLPGVSVAANEVIPDLLSLTAQQDSITFTVVGHSDDARQAAAIANTGAIAFTAELNKPGEGVGAFEVLARAVPPLQPQNGPGLARTLAGAFLAGCVLALGVLVCFLVLRGPIVSADSLTELSGVPCLGVVTITGRGRAGKALDLNPGLVVLLRRLRAGGHTAVVLLSPHPHSRGVRDLALLIRAAGGELVSPDRSRRAESTVAVVRPLDVEVGEPWHLLGGRPENACVLLVVQEGCPAGAVRKLSDGLMDGDVDGSVLVRPPPLIAKLLARSHRGHGARQPTKRRPSAVSQF
jgi:hypothetical protein